MKIPKLHTLSLSLSLLSLALALPCTAQLAAPEPPLPEDAPTPEVKKALPAATLPEADPGNSAVPAPAPIPEPLPAPPKRTNAKKWVVVPEFTDEFNGKELDLQKWKQGIHNWRGREPSLIVPDNVSMKDGCLNIVMKAEQHPLMDGAYRDYTTGAVSSLNRIRYGFFEVRAKAAKAQISSSFWLSHNSPDHWTEIDVFETIGKGPIATKRMNMNVHIFKTPDVSTHQESLISVDLDFDPTDSFHVYGLMWDATSIKWLLDGKTVRQKPNLYCKYPLHVIFDCEVMNSWLGEPDKADLPAVYQIDYVRTWQSQK